MSLPIAGLYFLCLSSAQKVMAEHWPRRNDGQQIMPNLKTFSLGAMSRATAAFVFCPITVVKTRMVGACPRVWRAPLDVGH